MTLCVYDSLTGFPDHVTRFTLPTNDIRRWDDNALVYDVRVTNPNGGVAGLRHYAFYGRWFVVNVSFDAYGHLLQERGYGIDWCFNCDVTTPLFSVGDRFYSVDLEFDVLVGADGRTHVVKDEDAFARSVSAGYIRPAEADGARRGLRELTSYLEDSATLAGFLDSVFPLNSFRLPTVLQPPPERLTLQDAPLLTPESRRVLYGLRTKS